MRLREFKKSRSDESHSVGDREVENFSSFPGKHAPSIWAVLLKAECGIASVRPSSRVSPQTCSANLLGDFGGLIGKRGNSTKKLQRYKVCLR
jgi:hypothetical protein